MWDGVWFWAGVGSATVSAIFYGVYKNKERTIRNLRDAVEFEIGPKLMHALTAAENHTIPYGVIRGEARPLKRTDTLRSPYVADTVGLIQRIKTREHRSEWSKTTRLWHNIERTISSSVSSVPFSLVSHGVLVKVTEPLSAEKLELKVIHDRFEPVSNTVADSLVQWAMGDKTKGFQTIEEMLPVSTTLTGIGEITLNEDGISIGPPKAGLTYYLSQLTLDAIIRQLQSGKRVWKILSSIFACVGGILFLVSLYFHYKRQHERQEQENLFRMMEHDAVGDDGEVRQEACVICMDRPRNVVILDCGHICCCLDCARQVNNCPVCRRQIYRLVPTYRS